VKQQRDSGVVGSESIRSVASGCVGVAVKS